MNRRYPYRSVLFAIITANSSLFIQPAAFAADPPKQDVRSQTNQHGADAVDECKQYLGEHRGHRGKGVDVVKVVSVDCKEKR